MCCCGKLGFQSVNNNTSEYFLEVFINCVVYFEMCLVIVGVYLFFVKPGKQSVKIHSN